MTSAAEAFADRHDLCATPDDVARIKRHLRKFYAAVEAIDRPRQSYIQLHNGAAIRAAFRQAMQSTMAADAVIAMAEMPHVWPTKYRASVAYHLAPILEDVVNS